MDHKKFLSMIGKKGGNTTKKKYGKKHFSKLGKMGTRKAKK